MGRAETPTHPPNPLTSGRCPGGPGSSDTGPQVWGWESLWGHFRSPSLPSPHPLAALGQSGASLSSPQWTHPGSRRVGGGPGSTAQPQEGRGRGSGEVTQTHPRCHLAGKGLLSFNHRVTERNRHREPGLHRKVSVSHRRDLMHRDGAESAMQPHLPERSPET